VLVLTTRASGRAALRVVEAGNYTARYVGVRVRPTGHPNRQI